MVISTTSVSRTAAVMAIGDTCGPMKASSAVSARLTKLSRAPEVTRVVKHRASYWKTIVIALGVALVCAAVFALVALSPLPAVAASLIALVPAIGLLLALVVVA